MGLCSSSRGGIPLLSISAFAYSVIFASVVTVAAVDFALRFFLKTNKPNSRPISANSPIIAAIATIAPVDSFFLLWLEVPSVDPPLVTVGMALEPVFAAKSESFQRIWMG